ncbi:peptidoglycan-binding protein [Mycetocola saprophilus]|uniref:peptidoglycan-binding protein n=1 Tax=Mycetocola saprophilus TaxID=76636 RepID=UPI003BF2C4B9
MVKSRDSGSDPRPGIKLDRITHAPRLIAFLIVAAILIALAFWIGTRVVSPADAALSNAPKTVGVTAQIESRVISDVVRLPATLTEGATASLFAPVPGETAAGAALARVVTKNLLAPGTRLTYGMAIAEVSGTPIFAAPGSMPLYRSIREGDSGTDVKELQSLLTSLGYTGAAPTGKADPQTMAALVRFYKKAGYAAPSAEEKPYLDISHWLRIPSDTGTVTVVAPQGTPLSTETPLITLQTSPGTLAAKATDAQSAKFAVGSDVLVQYGTSPAVTARVGEIGEVKVDDSTGQFMRTLSISIPTDAPATGGPIQILSSAEPEPVTAVPLVAIRHEGNSAYVIRAQEDSEPTTSPTELRIPITIIAQSDGWAAVTLPEDAPVGTEIVVTP